MKNQKKGAKAGKKMTEINVNTKSMIDAGNDIIAIANEIGEIVEEMFTRIERMPTVTKEWVGSSAEAFVQSARSDKQEYLNLKSALVYYGKVLVNCGQNYDNIITKCKLRW